MIFRHESSSGTLMSFLLGGLTGASLAVLLSPKSEETRSRATGADPAAASTLPEPAMTAPPLAREGNA